MPTTPPLLPLSSPPAWQEIGRPSPGEVQDWANWVWPLDRGGGDALYRSLVLADGAIAVTEELHTARHAGSGPRTVHSGRCGLPPDPEQTAERVRLLLRVADNAATRVVEAHHGSVVGAAAGRTRPAQHRAADDASQDAGRDWRASAAGHRGEDRTREHAPREPPAAAA